MRLILVLLVLIYTLTFVYAGDLTTTCKQLCADKKTCCSAPKNNEFYLKSMKECSSCENQKYFAESENFGIGSTITICSLNKGELYDVVKGGSSDGTFTDLASAVSAVSSAVSSSISSLASSIIGSGGFDNSYTGDDSGAQVKFDKSYKGGEGKLSKEDHENNYIVKKQHTSHAATLALEAVANSVASAMASTIDSSANPTFVKDGENIFDTKYKGGQGKLGDENKNNNWLLTKKKSHTSHAATLALQAVANSVQSAMSSTIDGAGIIFRDQLNKNIKDFIGGDSDKLESQPKRIIIGKCIKVSTVNSEPIKQPINDRPIINVSKQVCKELLGESCELLDEKNEITSVVQSTKNDGFANEGAFEVTREEYNLIIKHGQILRNQCELKGKCQFNRA